MSTTITLLLWIAATCVVSAATVTNATTATTHVVMARTEGRPRCSCADRVVIRAVITRAKTPMGCTTAIGEKPSAVSWHTIARMTMTVPSSHCRFATSRSICRIARPPLPSSLLPMALTPCCCAAEPNDNRNAPSRATGMPTYPMGVTAHTPRTSTCFQHRLCGSNSKPVDFVASARQANT